MTLPHFGWSLTARCHRCIAGDKGDKGQDVPTAS